MAVAGTSTLHDWESDITKAYALAQLVIDNGKLLEIKKLKVTVPVKGIISTKGSIMDNKTYDALKEDKNPNVYFTMTSASILDSDTDAPQIRAVGTMEIAGTTLPITLLAKGKLDSNGKITFIGSKDILMSDYNVKAPTALMGSIKTGDKVTVKYNVSLSLDKKGNYR